MIITEKMVDIIWQKIDERMSANGWEMDESSGLTIYRKILTAFTAGDFGAHGVLASVKFNDYISSSIGEEYRDGNFYGVDEIEIENIPDGDITWKLFNKSFHQYALFVTEIVESSLLMASVPFVKNYDFGNYQEWKQNINSDIRYDLEKIACYPDECRHSIEELNLPVNTRLALYGCGYNDVENLIEMPKEDLLENAKLGNGDVEKILQMISLYKRD